MRSVAPWTRIGLLAGASLAAASPCAAESALPADPLASPMWAYRAGEILDGKPVVFDGKVQLSIPMLAENQRQFPVMADARALQGVVRLLIWADLNPIPLAVDYRPVQALPVIATRIKLDQRTPVRAAAQTADGVWHMAGAWVDAAGGGCSAPPLSRARGDWADHLGELRGRLWFSPQALRLRFSLRHPMDTGLVANIPAFHIDQVAVKDADGNVLGELRLQASVAEDPAFTLEFAPALRGVVIEARDTSGHDSRGQLMVEKP
ncbi:quinoprotein dehydrogenase-associated SoxYZ-like carrier [Novosphingobium umbonatum]|uniref:Quinoprotein dehydrogenase-associated SoxYZ-like carrier n=1 Tax=Novosphingobium umbonatum TaxID=1908524 RepID=A0A3S2UX02_9SPHN|nr:quinoprotein dehydrogenase-associated SoxYZ-like carrier [Novosphingobium umbonatum]